MGGSLDEYSIQFHTSHGKSRLHFSSFTSAWLSLNVSSMDTHTVCQLVFKVVKKGFSLYFKKKVCNLIMYIKYGAYCQFIWTFRLQHID